ncbi:MAG: MFS transporter, partial [Burkholderiales bacterium]
MNHASSRKIIIACVLGNALEWYDFILYGYFAAIIGKQFFPGIAKEIQLIATFSVFASGFIMRPLGALLFGYMGDRFGRKGALAFSVLLMSIPTGLLSLLPTYRQIGLWAPILLTFIRLLQGLSVGGEVSGTNIFLVEHAPKNKTIFYGSFAVASTFLGMLVGALTTLTLTHCLTHSALHLWGWRIP